MKRWVTRERLRAADRCTSCGLLGTEALRAEQDVAAYEHPTVWRHPACGHLIMYRSGGRTTPRWLPLPAKRTARQ